MAAGPATLVAAGRSGGNTKDYHRTYTVVQQVIVTSSRDGPGTVVLASGIPPLYSRYVGYENTSDVEALCTDVKPEQDGDEWYKWRVTSTFTTNWLDGGNQNQNEDPEQDPVGFWIETEFQTKKITKEHDGTDIRNKAGQLIDGIERLDAIETWIWEKNYTFLNRSTWTTYQNTVNSDPVGEIEPHQGLLHIIVPKASLRNGQQFWRVQFRVKVNKDKWTIRPANRGYMWKNSDNRLERPRDEGGEPFDGEINLTEDGRQELDTEAEIIYLPEKHIYKPISFNALGVFT